MTSTIRHRLLELVFVIAAATMGFGAGPALAQKQGGTLTVGLELDILGFDPLKVGVYDTAANIAANLIFDTLTSLDDNGKVKPKLALSWSPSEDFKTWTFKLRPDVKFHDGTPFNAEAVAWNITRQKDPKNNCRCAFYISFINSVEAKDELTVVFNLRDPMVNMPALMTMPSSNNVIWSAMPITGTRVIPISTESCCGRCPIRSRASPACCRRKPTWCGPTSSRPTTSCGRRRTPR